jgi:hypothetical protein
VSGDGLRVTEGVKPVGRHHARVAGRNDGADIIDSDKQSPSAGLTDRMRLPRCPELELRKTDGHRYKTCVLCNVFHPIVRIAA